MAKLVRPGFLRIALTGLGVALLFAFAAPNLLRWRLAQDEVTAPSDLCKVRRAVKAYIAEHGTTPPALSSLQGRIEPALSCDARSCEYRGYRFRYAASQTSGEPRYSISAQGGGWRTTSYYVDESGQLRYTREKREATATDPSAVSAYLVSGPCRD